jgi:protocatechuate 3,4-dioxygenase alpha subunit
MSTPSQTVGPFLSIGLSWPEGPNAVPDGVRVGGHVYDGDGAAVTDALVEAWYPPAFARCPTDDAGAWFVVVPEAPFLAVSVFARGLLDRVVTRICFAEDAVPPGVPAARRHTLLAQPAGERSYRFDIRLQGGDETVFFDLR